MRRYWINTDLQIGQSFPLEGELFHHIFDVCRMQKGSKFELLNTKSQAYLVEVREVTKRHGVVEVLETRKILPLPQPYLNLILCVPKFAVLEAGLEKCVELGVAEIHLVYSDFSFIKSKDNLSSNKKERWQKIIQSATQQCGRGELMKVHDPIPLKVFLEKMNPSERETCLFAYESEDTTTAKTFLQKHKEKILQQGRSFYLIGSEGGFSDQEVSYFKQLGLAPISLGQQVLRVETACMNLTSILKYEFDLN